MSDTTKDHDFSASSADTPMPGTADGAGVAEDAGVDGGEPAEATRTTKAAKKAAPRKRATKKAAATTATDAPPKRRRRAVAPAGTTAYPPDSEALDASPGGGRTRQSAPPGERDGVSADPTNGGAGELSTEAVAGEIVPGAGDPSQGGSESVQRSQIVDLLVEESRDAAGGAAALVASPHTDGDDGVDGDDASSDAASGTFVDDGARDDGASRAATSGTFVDDGASNGGASRAATSGTLVDDDGAAAGGAEEQASTTDHADDDSASGTEPTTREPAPNDTPAADARPPQSAFGLLFQAPEAPARRRASRPAGAAVTAPLAPTEPPGAGLEIVLEPEAGSPTHGSSSHRTSRPARRGAKPEPAEPGKATAGERPTAQNSEDEPTGADTTDTADLAKAVAADSIAADAEGTQIAADAEGTQIAADAEGTEVDTTEDGATTGARSRRRRGGRGRRAHITTADADGDEADRTPEASGEEEETERHTDSDDTTDDDATNPARRRRRRRRSGAAGENEAPPGTVTRVREVRRARDEVASVRGSTRLEAKKQRRREGREAGRRRTIITEKEFLARRESVERVMVVRRLEGRTQIGVLEDGILVEHYVSRTTNASMAGNIYLGRVQNVLPSMEAAFVDIGRGRNAVLYAGEVNWDVAGLETGEAKRIENVLTSGESVLVQVTKDPIGHKGARLTAQISLPGRYLVYVPQGSMTGISRKLPDTERARLKAILKEIVPADAGVIVRTAAEGASEEELRRDVERLAKTWERVSAAAAGKAGKKTGNAPTLLYSEPDLTVRVIRDVFNEDFTSLVVSGDDVWQEISTYVDDVAPDLAARMTKWTDTRDIFSAHRIDEQLAKALDRKVYLPSGGSLVIDRTEAMTVVDVNTGKFVGSGGNLEETVTKNNLEAAEEIVRQLRLRDIGGIIVIDFIDMVLESNRDLVVRRLLECLGRDRTKHQVAEVTSLGLVQMTRKRVASGLLEVFSESCEHCHGRGVIVRSTPVDVGESHDPDRDPADTASRSTRGRARGRQAAEPAKASEPAPVRTGPTAAQIAAAAHAAAMKTAAPAAGDGPDSRVPAPTDELADLLADATSVATDDAVGTHVGEAEPDGGTLADDWTRSGPDFRHQGDSTTDSAQPAARDGRVGEPDIDDQPDRESGDDRDTGGEPDGEWGADPGQATQTDDETSADGQPSAGGGQGGTRTSGSSHSRGRRRRVRATAPAGPPRPASS